MIEKVNPSHPDKVADRNLRSNSRPSIQKEKDQR